MQPIPLLMLILFLQELILTVDEMEILVTCAISLRISQVIKDVSQSSFNHVMFRIRTAFSVHLDKLL